MITVGELKGEIDKVTYLASLASSPRALDIELDTLRTITASLQDKPDATVDEQSITKLQNLQQKIKQYLITNEPLRKFTAQTIDQALYEHTSGKNNMRQLRLTLAIIVVFAVLATIGISAAPLGLSQQIRGNIAGGIFFAVLHLGAVWMFLSALKWFRNELRPAYVFICLGLVIIGLSQLQTPLLTLAGVNTVGWISIITVLPFVFALSLIYLGARGISTVSSTESRFTSIPILLGVAAVLTLGSVLSPHAGNAALAWAFDISAFIGSVTIAFNIMAAGLMRGVARNVSPPYAKSMRWLYRLLVFAAFGNITGMILVHFSTDSTSIWVGILSLPFIVAGFIAVKAGYEFNKIVR